MMLLSLQWANPYTQPPAGQDWVLYWSVVSKTGLSVGEELIQKARDEGYDVSGYRLTFTPKAFTQFKPLKPESLASMRYNRLKTKLRKKISMPGFVEELLEWKKDYYDLETCRKQYERKVQINKELEQDLAEKYPPCKYVEIQGGG